MISIANRIEEIKKQLDELESHVNSTISVLDCKSIPLNQYPNSYESYQKFQWQNSGYYSESRPLYSENVTMEKLNEWKTKFDQIYESNKSIMERNSKTFTKLCAFFEKLGLSTTKYDYSGTGKKRHSYKTDSDWVVSLRSQYPMRDVEYENFLLWHERIKKQIADTFKKIRSEEAQQRAIDDRRREELEAVRKQEEERAKSVNLAVEFLMSQGKRFGIDFNNDNAIDKAFELKQEIVNNPSKPTISDVEKPKATNAVQFMEVEE